MGQLLMQPVLVGESVSFLTSDGSGFPVLSTRMEMLWGLVFLELSAVFFCSLAQGTPGMAPSPAPATASASSGTTNTATTAGPAPGGPAQPQPPQASTSDLQFSQLLGNLLGPAGPGTGGPGVASPTITVAMPGVPAFLQGMTDFLQVSGWLTLRFSLPLSEPSQVLGVLLPLGRNLGN